MFTFVDRETGRMLALRADITPQIARIVATRLRDEPKPLRLAYLGNVFRYDDPQVGRYREFFQAGVELVGLEKPEADAEMIAIARRIKPEMAMLVPEGRREVTTEGGLDVFSQQKSLKSKVGRLQEAGIVVSVFIDADIRQVEAAKRIGASVCEAHTGAYAHAFHAKGRDAESRAVLRELGKIRKAGERIRALGMRFNAGHALNYFNVEPVARLPGVRELHIGHAIVSRAVFVGMREAVREMKRLITDAAR
jgi:pyridoxine 5-phosphate synthase